jgi:hypothetical protein
LWCDMKLLDIVIPVDPITASISPSLQRESVQWSIHMSFEPKMDIPSPSDIVL